MQPARICKRLWGPGIDSKETIPPALCGLAGRYDNKVVVLACQAKNRFLGSLKGLQIRAQDRMAYVVTLAIMATG
jgi:hypothetical protein